MMMMTTQYHLTCPSRARDALQVWRRTDDQNHPKKRVTVRMVANSSEVPMSFNQVMLTYRLVTLIEIDSHGKSLLQLRSVAVPIIILYTLLNFTLVRLVL